MFYARTNIKPCDRVFEVAILTDPTLEVRVFNVVLWVQSVQERTRVICLRSATTEVLTKA